jgi:hypothetical protein
MEKVKFEETTTAGDGWIEIIKDIHDAFDFYLECEVIEEGKTYRVTVTEVDA